MIFIELDSLPPTSNHAYFTKGHVRTLTAAGKKYKADVIAHIVKHHATQTQELARDATISCFIAYGFPDLYTETWGKPDEPGKKKKKKAQYRFTRTDLANRPKLLQDAIVEATTFDDSQICFDFKYKYKSEKPETKIWIWSEDADPVGAYLVGVFAAVLQARVMQPH